MPKRSSFDPNVMASRIVAAATDEKNPAASLPLWPLASWNTFGASRKSSALRDPKARAEKAACRDDADQYDV
jgi:hypothetical protein